MIKDLNIWETDFRVILSKKMINKIKKEIIRRGGNYRLYSATSITPTIFYRLISGKGSAVQSYEQIIDFIGVGKDEAEKEITGLTYNGGKFVYPFIKKINPLLFRIVCHIIGDGTIGSRGTCRWIQHRTNSHWLMELIKNELGFEPTTTRNGSTDMVTISAYFSRLIKYMLGIDYKNMKNSETIKTFLNLPKEYKLQFLAAFIVDEGHIRYKKAKSCIISQKEGDVLMAVSSILDSLGYLHSEIKRETCCRLNFVHRINIYSTGMLRFYEDIQDMIKKYGNYAGLWQKQVALEKYIAVINKDEKYTKIEKDLINNLISALFDEKIIVSYADIREHPILKQKIKLRSKLYLINKFYELAKSDKFTRLSKGLYIKNQQNI